MTNITKKSVIGIVAEYNPFHNGHSYHIQMAKKLTGAEYCIVVMSGNFVQRGDPAVFDKHTRTAMALASGADLVIEIPTLFATSSAEDFSACSVALLDQLGVVDSICFGSEVGEIAPMMQIAHILAHEPAGYTKELKDLLRHGFTYPEARNLALLNHLTDDSEIAAFLATPNNILGIEYCKALIRRNSSIQPYTIDRTGGQYHDSFLDKSYSSATAIRKVLKDSTNLITLQEQIPESAFEIIKDKQPLFSDSFSTLLNTTILRLIEEGVTLSDYADVSTELEARIRRFSLDFASYENRILQLKTKQYTHTRISRALLHIMLGIKKEDVEQYRSNDYVPYARILGFRKSSAELLTMIHQNSTIPLITKTADASKLLSSEAYTLLQKDFYSTHLYNCIWNEKYPHMEPLKNEYNRPLVIL